MATISIGQLFEQKFNIYCGSVRSRPKNENKNEDIATIALYKLSPH